MRVNSWRLAFSLGDSAGASAAAALPRLTGSRTAGGKVADVADTRFHHVLVAQVLVDGLGLGR